MAELPMTNNRIRTGIAGLDELLGGGLLEGRTVLLKGAPGSGKTTLGLQMLIAGALHYDEPGVLLTFEQISEQLFEDAAAFGWDLRWLVAQKKLLVKFIQPEEVLEQPGRQENRLLVNIADWVEDFGARRILIDSISHLRPFFRGDQARAMMMRFLVQLKNMKLTPVMTSELSHDDGLEGLDAYLVDTVIHLAHHSKGVGRADRREIEIIKTRGQRHIGGVHPLEIGPDGLTVYPHTTKHMEAVDQDLSAEAIGPRAPISTGVAGLNPLLNGGYTPGSAILVAGLSGTFKTTVASQFMCQGGDEEGRGLWISFQESASSLETLFKVCTTLPGDSPAERCSRIHVLEFNPGCEPVEKILMRAEEVIAAEGVDRVVIDSINDLTCGLDGDEHRQEATQWFLRRLRALGVTTLMTQRLARVTGRNPLSEIAWAELADTIVYLGLVEIESRLEKVISVLKHRGGPTEGDLRSIHYTAHGLRVSDRFVGLSGVLAGTALGRPKARIEEIFQPLYFIRDFLALAQDPQVEGDKRDKIMTNLSSETAQLIGLLSRYFDQPLAQKKAGEANQRGGGTKS